MSNIAIEFNNVGKMYRLGLVGTGTLSHDLNRWWTMNVLRKEDPYLKIGQTNDRTTKGDSDYVWALRDISFKVEQGDVVGIIGKNGAGKSTLLKLLSHITAPTTGSIRYNGRIASLLEVGTGFHPEMTGRENIYMNGSIMGMTKAEITRKLDEIVDFAGVERYLDTPVKRYSSGMTVRLGFAVAAFLEPEILVVDEVLTVGDAEFQKKAIGKMQDVSKGEGRTVLFVSHNMGSIKALCNSCVLLRNGQVAKTGNTNDVIEYYLNEASADMDKPFADRRRTVKTSGSIQIQEIYFETTGGKRISTLLSGQDAYVCMKYRKYTPEPVYKVNVSISMTNNDHAPLFLIHSRMTGDTMDFVYDEGVVKCLFRRLPLNQGVYNLSFSLMENNGRGGYIDQLEDAIRVSVEQGDFYKTGELAPINFGQIIMDGNFSML